MLNKKNISMAMAAATAVSAFAPMTTAFADVLDSTQEQEIKALKEKVAEKFTTKYTEEAALLNGAVAGNSVYTVGIFNRLATQDDVDNSLAAALGDEIYDTYRSYAAFEKAFDAKFADLKSGETIKVKYTEGLNRVLENGQVVNSEDSEYVAGDLVDATDTIGGVATTVAGAGTIDRKIEVETKADMTKVGKIQISDQAGEERFITVKEGDAKLDLTRPIYRQVNGYYVDANNTPIKKVDKNVVETITSIPNGVIDGYYKLATAIVGTPKVTYDAIVKDEVKKVELNASDLYEFYAAGEGRLTKEGNELFKNLRATHADADYEVVLDGTVVAGNVLNVNKINADATRTLVTQITVKDDQTRRADDAYSFLIANLVNLATANTNSLEVDTAAGNDRYETAVELAKKGFATSGEVVLVSGANDKLVDGLTATPLAATLNGNAGAPVLLTQAGKLPESVVKYLDDANTNKVYIVGGESAVNGTVEKELKDRYGMEVVRIEGADRYETSINVAKEVQANNAKADDTAYVVGGRAEADALSISAKAGADKQPIILAPQSGMTNEIKYALKGITNAHIIGGESSVSDAVAQGLVDAGVTNVTRTKGDNRQETNAAVIAKFHNTMVGAGEVVFAKSNNAGLVDALGAGAYAAEKQAPLVLATDSLTESQEDALQPHKTAAAKTQAGYGVKDVVAKFIAALKA